MRADLKIVRRNFGPSAARAISKVSLNSSGLRRHASSSSGAKICRGTASVGPAATPASACRSCSFSSCRSREKTITSHASSTPIAAAVSRSCSSASSKGRRLTASAARSITATSKGTAALKVSTSFATTTGQGLRMVCRRCGSRSKGCLTSASGSGGRSIVCALRNRMSRSTVNRKFHC